MHEFARTTVTAGLPDEDLLDAPWSVVRARGSGTAGSDDVLDLEQGNRMLEIIDEGLQQGASGVASTVGSFPGATVREMFEAQRVGTSWGRPTSVHLRYSPGTVTTEPHGAQEILANAVALGARVVVNHCNNRGWERVPELLVRLPARGHDVWGEIHPFAAGQTTINAAFVPRRKAVKENATYAKGTLPTTGIPFVIVGGTVVGRDSRVLEDVTPGQPVRDRASGKPGAVQPIPSRFILL